MGSWASRKLSQFIFRKHRRVLILGLDGAGKTSKYYASSQHWPVTHIFARPGNVSLVLSNISNLMPHSAISDALPITGKEVYWYKTDRGVQRRVPQNWWLCFERMGHRWARQLPEFLETLLHWNAGLGFCHWLLRYRPSKSLQGRNRRRAVGWAACQCCDFDTGKQAGPTWCNVTRTDFADFEIRHVLKRTYIQNPRIDCNNRRWFVERFCLVGEQYASPMILALVKWNRLFFFCIRFKCKSAYNVCGL